MPLVPHAVATMKQFFLLSVGVLTLAACTDTTGLSEESSRPPRGNPNAAVVVTEFADLQCPACRTAHETITLPLIEQYGDQIRLELKHFPLRTIHPYALQAAMAAECAADQGKFWEFVDYAYENQPDLSARALDDWGVALGLDIDLYERCRDSKIKNDTILADYDEGVQAGVGGTPTYFVNGEQVPATYGVLSAEIEAALSDTYQRL